MYYQLAQQEFESYLNGYDRENDRIKLKIIHTYGVVKQADFPSVCVLSCPKAFQIH